jgi:hypothetical protein
MWIDETSKPITIEVTAEDIAKATHATWDDPIYRAIKRILSLKFEDYVRVGWGYAQIATAEVIDDYNFVEVANVSNFLRSWQNNWTVTPSTFSMYLVASKPKKVVAARDDEKPRRYAKTTGI